MIISLYYKEILDEFLFILDYKMWFVLIYKT